MTAHSASAPKARIAVRAALLLACGCSGLGALGAILRAALRALDHSDRIERPANDVIPHARKILHTAAADEHDRVLLQVVALAGNVRRHLNAVRQADTGNLAERRVRLLGRLRVYARANSAPLRRSLQCRGGRLIPRCGATLPYQLTECRQTKLLTNPNRFISTARCRIPPAHGKRSTSAFRAKSQSSCFASALP